MSYGRPRKYATAEEARRVQREAQRQRMAEYAATGRCPNCGRPRDLARTRCSRCLHIRPKPLALTAPRLPFYQVVKQFISSIPAPVRGSIALAMACAPRSAA